MVSQATVKVRIRDLRIAILLAACSFLYYLVFYHGHFCGSDEVVLFETTRSIVDRGDLAIPDILNAEKGPDGRAYGRYEIGQSLLAIPFYEAGEVAAWVAPSDWQTLLAGAPLQDGSLRWGGEIEIFVTGLFSPLVAALLVAVFFWTQRQLGTSTRAAALLSAVLAFSTYTATMSGYFLRHVAPAALLLAAFGWLRRYRETRSAKTLLIAGILLAVGLQTRMDVALALPGFLFYALWDPRRRPASRREQLARLLPLGRALILPVLISAGLLLYVNYLKWHGPIPAGADRISQAFRAPLHVSLYAFLLSPGLGFFAYSPPALLALSAWKGFWRNYRAEAITLLWLVFIFLLTYSAYEDWHGLWSAPGPRYLFVLVPFVLLPVGRWLDGARRRLSWAWVSGLSAVGFIFQIPLMTVNFAYAYHYLGYADDTPPYSFVFIPGRSPLVTGFRLLWEGNLADSWLLNLWRGWAGTAGHPVLATSIFIAIASLLAVLVWRLSRNVREAGQPLAAGS